MGLYSASLMENAVPVLKTKRVRKIAPKVDVVVADEFEKDIDEAVAEIAAPLPKKRVMSEEKKAQLAAGRKAKKDAEEAKKAAARLAEEGVKAAEEAIEAAKNEKKAAANLKRKMSRAKKTEEAVTAVDESVGSVGVESEQTLTDERVSKGKKAKIVDDNEPPAWFKSYVKGVKNEENAISGEKKAKKTIAAESEIVANEKWSNGLVRDRVRGEQDRHMERTYSMIFGRTLK